MAVRVRRAHLSTEHAVRGVPQFVDILRFNGLGEAGPAASRIKLVGRREQRLAGYDIDVDARFLVIQIFSGSGSLGAVLLRYVILLGRELLNCIVVLAELSHLFSPYQTYTKLLCFSVTLERGIRIAEQELGMTIRPTGGSQMKIFVAGGTGAIGRPLMAELLAKGHSPVALTRYPEKAQALAEQGIEPAIADVFDADAVKAAVSRAQAEVVIEQLTALPKHYTRESMS